MVAAGNERATLRRALQHDRRGGLFPRELERVIKSGL